jgi:3-deoxy-D-manno-octulosonic-acid transferase
MINGRISKGSFAGYKLFRFFLSPILNKINIFCMQTEVDARRIITLGAPNDRVVVTGNIKFDLEPPTKIVYKLDFGLDSSCLLLIAGSTHRGEERIILEVYKELVKDFSNFKLLLAPRHIDRVKELEELVKQFELEALRFSNRADNDRVFDVMLLDTIGELASIYSAGDIVFVGGSLVDKGGQNIIEPAMLSKPVIFGPYMSNFAQIRKIFLKEKAAIQVKDKLELKKSLINLLSDAGNRKVIGKRASDIIAKNNGAARKTLGLISKFIK